MVKSVGAAGLERIELKRVTERLGKLYSVLLEAAETESAPLAGAWTPAVDVCESPDAVLIRMELPGVSANQIKIALSNDKIRICGEKKRRKARQRIVSHLCSERSYGRFNRVIPLRWTISIKDSFAELRDGVLLVRLPKIRDRRGLEHIVPIQEIAAEDKS
jgi:HSP20 family protein